ncbi:MAG: NB-ARC domain-containing protein [Prochloraceae cyanobacterium]
MAQKPRSLKRKRGIMLSVRGCHRLQEAQKQLAIKTNKKHPYTLEELNEITGLCPNTLIKVRDRKFPVDRKTLEKYFQAFHLKLHPSDYSQPEDLDRTNSEQIIPIQQDWDEAMDIGLFYGRKAELATLEQWIVKDKCRLIAILGIGGIGKTALAIELAQKIKTQFHFIIWRSLGNGQSLETLLTELVAFLSQKREKKANINSLLKYLREYRCLLILDNLDSILAAGKRGGKYRSGYENYKDLLINIGSRNHNSCLLLTSREKPSFLAGLEGVQLAVRSLFLKGCLEACLGLIEAQGLIGSETEKHNLCKIYSCNPLEIKIISTLIQDLFAGKIEDFLACNIAVFNGIQELIDPQFDRLDPLEKNIMYWLAVNRDWTTIEELERDIIPFVSRANLLAALESLKCRSLIKSLSGSYTQEPIIMEYVTTKIIEKITTELLNKKICLFARLALIKTNISASIENPEARLILETIAKALSTNLEVEQHLQTIFNLLKANKNNKIGYGIINLINLANYLKIDPNSYDISSLNLDLEYPKNKNLNSIDSIDRNSQLSGCQNLLN